MSATWRLAQFSPALITTFVPLPSPPLVFHILLRFRSYAATATLVLALPSSAEKFFRVFYLTILRVRTAGISYFAEESADLMSVSCSIAYR
jgi:hypothetical protein